MIAVGNSLGCTKHLQSSQSEFSNSTYEFSSNTAASWKTNCRFVLLLSCCCLTCFLPWSISLIWFLGFSWELLQSMLVEGDSWVLWNMGYLLSKASRNWYEDTAAVTLGSLYSLHLQNLIFLNLLVVHNIFDQNSVPATLLMCIGPKINFRRGLQPSLLFLTCQPRWTQLVRAEI